jgi:hypothetical protein
MLRRLAVSIVLTLCVVAGVMSSGQGRALAAFGGANCMGASQRAAEQYCADVVLGQPDFNEVTPYATTPDKTYIPHGVAVDAATGNFYVYDSGHNRILGVQPGCTTAPQPACAASVVLGQPDNSGTTSACNGDSAFQSYPARAVPTNRTLCTEQESQLSISEGGSAANMALKDGALYVADFYNNRVLKFDNPFTNQVASKVWGQGVSVTESFGGNLCSQSGDAFSSPANASATSLCFFDPTPPKHSITYTGGVDVDALGNVWVADSDNNRVVRFPANSGQADIVLGQAGSFVTRGSSASDLGLDHPGGVRLSSDGQRLYIVDRGNHRIVYYALVNGQWTFAGKHVFSTDPAHPVYPEDLELDPDRGRVWVSRTRAENTQQFVIEAWDSNLSSPDPNVDVVGLRPNGDAYLLGAPGAFAFTATGDILIAPHRGEYADDVVLVRRTASSPRITFDNVGTKRLFQTQTAPRTTSDFGASVHAVAWSKSPYTSGGPRSQLIVGEDRILFWDNPSAETLQNHQPASGYVGGYTAGVNANCPFGSTSATCSGDLITGANSAVPGFGMALAASKNYLFVSNDTWGPYPSRILVYRLPLKTGDVPVTALRYRSGITGYGQPLPMADGGELKAPCEAPGLPNICNPVYAGLAVSDELDAAGVGPHYLWVSDRDADRVFRITNPLQSPSVDIVLGQVHDATYGATWQCNLGTTNCDADPSPCNPTVSNQYLCHPGGIGLARNGDLYVSDHWLEHAGNRRMLRFSSASLNPSPGTVLYGDAVSATDRYTLGADELASWQPSFDPTGTYMVTGYNPYGWYYADAPGPVARGYFPGVYSLPVGAPAVPPSTLSDFFSMATSSAWDECGDLYIADLNRARVLLYRRLAPNAVPQLPDLTVSAVYGDTRGWADVTSTVRIVITNGGWAASGPTTVRVSVPGYSSVDLPVPALSCGESAVILYNPPSWMPPPRVKTISYLVDAGGLVSEANEANNTRTRSLGMAQYVYDVNGDGSVTSGDLGLVSASIRSVSSANLLDPMNKWNPDADLDGNGVVDDADRSLVGAHFGDVDP